MLKNIILQKKLHHRIFRKQGIKRVRSISSPVQILKNFHRQETREIAEKKRKNAN